MTPWILVISLLGGCLWEWDPNQTPDMTEPEPNDGSEFIADQGTEPDSDTDTEGDTSGDVDTGDRKSVV